MTGTTKLVLFVLPLVGSGFGCAADDHVVGSEPMRGSGIAGWSQGFAGGNGAKTSGNAGAGGVGGSSAGALGTGKAGSASGGANSNAGHGGARSLGSGGIGSNSGGVGGVATGGSWALGGSGNASPGGGVGVSLNPTNGWVDGTSNQFAIQGSLFADADSTSIKSLTSNWSGGRACITGTAAKVDTTSAPCTTLMFTPPAEDCYGQYWGAAVGLNLNQRVVAGPPLPFDAAALAGFAFEISGETVPAPSALRIQVEGPAGKFCNASTIKIRVGDNAVLFSDLFVTCWMPWDQPTAETAKSALVSVKWWVVTNSQAVVPFDFCVSNIRAIAK
jgi:hypothetical protein